MPAIKMDKMPQIAIMAIFGRFLNLLDNASYRSMAITETRKLMGAPIMESEKYHPRNSIASAMIVIFLFNE